MESKASRLSENRDYASFFQNYIRAKYTLEYLTCVFITLARYLEDSKHF